MVRPLRIEYPGAFYHVTARGNARAAIFHGDDDRRLFLDVTARAVERSRLALHAYCLMDNHYHLVVETPLGNLSAAIHHLNGVYAQTLNQRHGRVGHLFQGRYKAILVERDSHLLELCRYVVLNPVRAGLCSRPEEWPWSSYRATAGLAPRPPLLTTDFVLAQFGRTAGVARMGYRAFVDDRAAPPALDDLRGEIFLGDVPFIRSLTDPPVAEPEIPHRQREPIRPTLDELLADHGEPGIAVAVREHSYTLREIAAHIGCHYSTVSRRLRMIENGETPPRRRHRQR
jgi:putative transposase